MTGKTDNLSPVLWGVLLELEKRLGKELTITSGYRTPAHNASPEVGGVTHSEHTHQPADGADILVIYSGTRYTLVKEALEMGVSRIGIGADFVHIGVATNLPQHVLWTYYEPKAKEKEPPRAAV